MTPEKTFTGFQTGALGLEAATAGVIGSDVARTPVDWNMLPTAAVKGLLLQ